MKKYVYHCPKYLSLDIIGQVHKHGTWMPLCVKCEVPMIHGAAAINIMVKRKPNTAK